MNSRPLITIKRFKVSVSCCRGAMSRWCSRVGILAVLFVVPELPAAAIPLMCIIIEFTDHITVQVGLLKFKLKPFSWLFLFSELNFPIARRA